MDGTFRVVGMCRRTGRERVVAQELSWEAAQAMREQMTRDPILAGIAVWVEPTSEKRDELGRPIFTECERALHGL